MTRSSLRRENKHLCRTFFRSAGTAFMLFLLMAPTAMAQAMRARSDSDIIKAVVLKDVYPTYFFDDKTQKPSGFAVDMMNSIAKRAGLQITYIYARDFADLMNMLLREEADVIPSFAITPEREKFLDFTKPLDSSPLFLFVRENNNTISGLHGGITVGVSKGGVPEIKLRKKSDVNVKLYGGYSEPLFDLLSGHIDAIAAAQTTILGLARKAGVEGMIKIAGPSHGEVRRAIAVREGDIQLLARLDRAIEGFIGSPEYQKIFSKWYGEPDPLLTPGRITAASAVALLIIIGLMTGWRYVSVMRLNRELTNAIEELKRAEKEVRFLASIVHNLPEAVCGIDTKGDTISWNRGAEMLLGYRPEEIIGKPIKTIIPEEIAQAELEHCLTILNKEGGFSGYESVRLTKQGKRVPVEITGVAIRDNARKITSYASIMMNISERKMAEKERLKAHMLESIGFLAEGMAHDFNNLLTIILSNISIAKTTLQSKDEAYVRITHAEEICGMATGLCRRLLVFATGGDPVKKTISLQTLLIDTVTELLKDTNIVFQYDLPGWLYTADLDEAQMKQVIANLVSNAKEAMPQGGTLAVRGENLDISARDSLPLREGSYLKISIHDSGAGIPLADLARIFDPYYSTKETYQKKGLGLDLAVCYSIIKRHDGLMTVDSDIENGTTFHIFLPATDKI